MNLHFPIVRGSIKNPFAIDDLARKKEERSAAVVELVADNVCSTLNLFRMKKTSHAQQSRTDRYCNALRAHIGYELWLEEVTRPEMGNKIHPWVTLHVLP